jgi:hypothetical protein
MNSASSYQCGFCDDAIKETDFGTSVVLSATSLKDVTSDNDNPRRQNFYIHMHCLLSNCQTNYGWETEALIETN